MMTGLYSVGWNRIPNSKSRKACGTPNKCARWVNSSVFYVNTPTALTPGGLGSFSSFTISIRVMFYATCCWLGYMFTYVKFINFLIEPRACGEWGIPKIFFSYSFILTIINVSGSVCTVHYINSLFKLEKWKMKGSFKFH